MPRQSGGGGIDRVVEVGDGIHYLRPDISTTACTKAMEIARGQDANSGCSCGTSIPHSQNNLTPVH